MSVRTAPRAGRHLPPERFLVLISVSAWIDHGAGGGGGSGAERIRGIDIYIH
jgi:hypothetical protein